MLPNELLAFTSSVRPDDAFDIRPEFLAKDAEDWVGAILSRASALAHAPALTFDRALDDTIWELARERKIGLRALRGVEKVIRRRWTSGIVSVAPPPRVREVLFGLAARMPKEEALAQAEQELGIDRTSVLVSLFADRPARKRMVPPDAEQTSVEVVARYNLALVQALLMRSVEVVVRVVERAPLMVRIARMKGLMVHTRQDGDVTELAFSGPLSLLRDTTKYGHALASFFPSVLATAGWSLSARVRIDDAIHHLALDHRDPIGSPHVLPVDTDGRVGRRLMRDVRKLRNGWEARPESVAIDIEGELFFPDFTLERCGHRVLVEIVGFWTEDYLREKLRRLRAAPHVLVCVDKSIATPFSETLGARVLPFEKFIDAAALLEMASECPQERRA